MVKSGLIYPFGMGFWGPNGHDGVWHLALINSLSRGSWEMPIFSGENIRNYHIGFDLILAWIHKLTQIPAITLYFQILPTLLAVLVGWLTYRFVMLWRNSSREALWATFFVYFAGDFGWIVTLIRNKQIGGESLFWSQQSISTLINPPFAMSLVLLLSGAILILKLKNKFSIWHLALAIIFFGLLAEIKIYAGILALAGLLVIGIYQLIKSGKFTFLSIFGGSAVLSMLLFLPLNSGSQKMIVFQPFWFLETMMAVSDRFGWPRFYEALMNYKTGHIFLKLIPAYFIAFLIFLVGNMGTRVVGVYGIIKNKLWRKFSQIDLFLLVMASLGIILPMFFLQSGTPWNTIQFFYYSLFVMSILSGIWLAQQKTWLIILVVLLTLSTTIGTLSLSYLPMRPPAKISHQELAALKFLEKQPQGVVLTYPFDEYKAELAVNNPPRPLYLYASSAYVSAFSQHPTYLEDEINLNITGFDWRNRREKSMLPFDSLNQEEVQKFLADNKIHYLYLVLNQTPVFGQRFRLGEGQLGLTNIFENQEVVIYRVN